MLTIVSPIPGSDFAVGQKVCCEATSGDPCSNPTTGADTSYTPPSNITGTDSKGNKTDTPITITVKDPLSLCAHQTPVSANSTIYIVKDPKKNCNCACNCNE